MMGEGSQVGGLRYGHGPNPAFLDTLGTFGLRVGPGLFSLPLSWLPLEKDGGLTLQGGRGTQAAGGSL